MYDLIYLALKTRLLASPSLGLKLVDWYTDQSRPNNGQAHDRPAVYIEFLPSTWSSSSERVQQAVQDIRLHIVQDRVTDRRSDDPDLTANLSPLSLQQAIYTRLQGWGATFTFRAQTYQLLNSMRRTQVSQDHRPGQQLIETAVYRTFVRDWAAHPDWDKYELSAAITAQVEV